MLEIVVEHAVLKGSENFIVIDLVKLFDQYHLLNFDKSLGN